MMSLTRRIQKMLFEDTWNEYGSEYMSHPIDQEDQLTIQPDLPIVPSPLASMQLTDSAPPVDDDSYVPTNNKELATALAVLALKVPDRFVENLYRQIRTAVVSAEALADTSAEEIPAEEAIDSELEEGLTRLVKHLIEATDEEEEEWRKFRHGGTEAGEEYVATEDEVAPDTIPGKYLAQYQRERPGKDPSKFKGSGESTMVTASGRLLQNVVRPLLDVPKEQLKDAAEYLRLQFRTLARDREDIPDDAPRTFSGMYLKKLVPKLKEDQLGKNFLQTVVVDFKNRNKNWLNNLVTAAFEEVSSEKVAREKLRSTLEKESPRHAELVDWF